MRLDLGRLNSDEIILVVGHETTQRLMGTCFRRGSVPLAGNFRKWRRPIEVLNRREISSMLRQEIFDTITESAGRNSNFSVTLTDPNVVGWASTAPLKDFQVTELEFRNVNKRAEALFVRTEASRFAPETKEITLVFRIQHNPGEVVVIIQSMYPGPDIGELEGDISAREQVVFFAWNHPGEPVKLRVYDAPGSNARY